MNSIRETVESALEPSVVRQYGNYISPVVRALESREEEVVTSVRTHLSETESWDTADIDNFLVTCGLMAAPEVRMEGQGLEAQIASLLDEVRTLNAAVKQQGERIDRAAEAARGAGVHF